MGKQFPQNEDEFNALMQAIDEAQTKEGVGIPGRTLDAIRRVGMEYGLELPIGTPPAGAPAHFVDNAKISARINDWFNAMYGDRMKIDMTAGRAVISIAGDLYTIKSPRIFGSAQFVLRRDFIAKPSSPSRGPAICNVVQLVENLTEAKAKTLSDDALRRLWEDFIVGFEALDKLETTQDEPLIRMAFGDIQTAVIKLMDRGDRFGESKWASLQAAEKTLKAAIRLQGATFKYSHKLQDVFNELAAAGVTVNAQPYVAAIQCTPGIRYGEETCSRDEALAAHRATLQLVNELAAAGAKLRSGMGGQRK